MAKTKEDAQEKIVVMEEPEDEKPEEEKLTQMQFEGTDGFGIIAIKYGDSYGSPERFYDARWEIQDKFFHILEKGKEKEEGLFIPLSKVRYFRFDRQGDLPPCGNTECQERKDDGEMDCEKCRLNSENMAKLEICGEKECRENFNCSYCDENPENQKPDEEEED